ncbi:MAG TPA: cobalt ECF transporter T component CbiQ [Vicinamibacteria bacterium]|nr:cobalt ECF transporter T component CbiQ [Vicinamibacteria bacterium]
MRHDFVDKWSRIESPVHRLPPGWKLAGTLAIVLAVVAVPLRVGWFFAAMAAGLVILGVLSRIPGRFLLGRLLLLEPFVLGIALLSFLQPGGGRAGLAIVLRSTFCLATAVLLTNTTPFSDILQVLRRIHVPALLVTTIALMYRYLFVLVEEAGRMQRARAGRTLRPGRAFEWRTTAALAGQLFLRSTERAERIYAAMCARGWR